MPDSDRSMSSAPPSTPGPPPRAQSSTLIGRYVRGEPVPLFWKRTFDFIIWALPIVLLGDGATARSGGGGSTDARYDGGSCVCGSEPKFCGKFPHCKWKPRRVG
jgi:hypothetical protein